MFTQPTASVQLIVLAPANITVLVSLIYSYTINCQSVGCMQIDRQTDRLSTQIRLKGS